MLLKDQRTRRSRSEACRNGPSLRDLYPAIAEYTSGWGWIEVGEANEITGKRGITARALDEGVIWESKRTFQSADEAFRALEVQLRKVIDLGL